MNKHTHTVWNGWTHQSRVRSLAPVGLALRLTWGLGMRHMLELRLVYRRRGQRGRTYLWQRAVFFALFVRRFECVFGFVMVMEAVHGCLHLPDSPWSLTAFLCITTWYLVFTNPKRRNASWIIWFMKKLFTCLFTKLLQFSFLKELLNHIMENDLLFSILGIRDVI